MQSTARTTGKLRDGGDDGGDGGNDDGDCDRDGDTDCALNGYALGVP